MSRLFEWQECARSRDHMYGVRDCVVFRSTFDLEGRGQTCLTTMMKDIATVGGPDFLQTAINIDGLGWSNNGGGG